MNIAQQVIARVKTHELHKAYKTMTVKDLKSLCNPLSDDTPIKIVTDDDIVDKIDIRFGSQGLLLGAR